MLCDFHNNIIDYILFATLTEHSFIQNVCSTPFLEILEESVFFDENKQDFVQEVGEENWLMTITFLLLFFVSLCYGILVTLIKVRQMYF